MEPGTTISTGESRYELLGEIASGGMATVYRARVVGEVERPVALKRIHPHLSKEHSIRAMFLDEARIVARIDHPNVCRILDYGQSDGEAFIAMELLTGVTLSKVLARLARRAPSDETWFRFVSTVVAEAAEGLHAAHEARGPDGEPLEIVHRDISPSNLFLTHDGMVKVLDFGIAKARDRVHTSSTGEVKGKFSYMSPEQLRSQTDRRSDVWSLGVVYYELLTLRPLFRRETQPETIIAVERDPVLPIAEVRPELARFSGEVALDALRREPDERIASGAALASRVQEVLQKHGGLMSRREVVNYLREVLGEEALRAPPPPEPTAATVPETPPSLSPDAAPTPVARVGGRPSRWLAGAVALAAAGLGGFAAWSIVGPPEERPRARSAAASVAQDAGSDAGGQDAGGQDAGEEDTGEEAQPSEGGTAPEVVVAPVRPDRRPVARAHPTPPQPPPARPPEPPPEPPAPAGVGSLFVPLGVAVCIDRPCRGAGQVVHGPRLVPNVASGPHRVRYVDPGGPPTSVIAERTVEVVPNARVSIPRP